jgi:hypothetical protein
MNGACLPLMLRLSLTSHDSLSALVMAWTLLINNMTMIHLGLTLLEVGRMVVPERELVQVLTDDRYRLPSRRQVRQPILGQEATSKCTNNKTRVRNSHHIKFLLPESNP